MILRGGTFSGSKAICLLVLSLAGCGTNPPAAPAPVANNSAPSAPPPPPGAASPAPPVSGTAAPAGAPAKTIGKAPIPQLQPYWGNNYLVLVFAPSADHAGFKKVQADWQAKQTDSTGQPIVFVQLFGGGGSASPTGGISGGASLAGEAASNLWDIYGASSSVTGAFLVGKDGQTLLNARRGGDINLAEALEPL
jgi:hypothetical protein